MFKSYILVVKPMLEIIKSYLKNEHYYIILTEKSLLIKNYKKIINITDSEVIIELQGKTTKIKGNNLSLKKSIGKDLEIKGIIESVKYL